MCLGLFSELKLEGHKEGGKEAIVVVGGGNFQSAGWQCPHGGGQIVRHLSAQGSIPGMRETTLKGIFSPVSSSSSVCTHAIGCQRPYCVVLPICSHTVGTSFGPVGFAFGLTRLSLLISSGKTCLLLTSTYLPIELK